MFFSTLIKLSVLAGIAAALPAADLQTRNCEAHIQNFVNERRAKRAVVAKRSYWPQIQNNTCITSPETPLDSNWVAGAPVRGDITQGQSGTSMILDIGVMDMTTCQSLPNTMVEVWQPNAAGQYGTFLRGAGLTGSNGIAEFNTIFPGFASGSANHINIMVHQSGSTSTAANAPVSHIGRAYFTDSWTNVVTQFAPYTSNTNSRLFNDQDPVYTKAASTGYAGIIDIEDIHDDWPEGVVGYITVGVNPTAKVAH